ncbi:MAG TPA: hypothetical protein GXX26_12100 [Clostridiaceae bacterium]|jgi:hypothetical protein|nr:hypothetical protein [Clostridiaceae bacterium]
MSEAKDINKTVDDSEVKRKAVKLVVAHLKKKVTREYMGIQYLIGWLEEMDELLNKEEFDIKEYYAMRKQLNSVIESTLDEEMRSKIRNSWHSFGKALEKKVKPY